MAQLTEQERDVLRRLLQALGPAKAEFLIAGGQAARLLRLHPLARELDWEPLLTHDVDVATKDKGLRAGLDLGAALVREGFAARLGGAGDGLPAQPGGVRHPEGPDAHRPPEPREEGQGRPLHPRRAPALHRRRPAAGRGGRARSPSPPDAPEERGWFKPFENPEPFAWAAKFRDQTGLPSARLNLAAELIEALGLAEVARCLGSEHAFTQIDATSRTRKWVREHAV